MFTLTVEPRFGDIDGLKHVNNTILAQWFENARNPFFRMFTPDLNLDYQNWKLIMARTDFDFLNQITYGHKVQIQTQVLKIGNTSFTLQHQAWQQEKLMVKGSAVIVHYDFINQKTVPIPDSIRDQLIQHLVSDTDPKTA